MSHSMQPLALDLALPWQTDTAQEERFKKILKRVVIPFLILFLLLPFLPELDLGPGEAEERIVKTKVILEPKIVEPPPPPPKPKPAEPVRPREVKPIPDPVPQEAPAYAPRSAEEQKDSIAKSQGLNNLSNQLGALRQKLDLAKLQNKNVSDSSQGKVMHSDRQVLGKENVVRSDGIIVDDSDMRNAGVELAGYQATEVAGVIQGGSEFGDPRSSHLSYQQGKRDMESIRRTLEQTKSRVHTLYQKALLDHPDLGGKFKFKLVIEPSGEVSNLQLLTSELNIDDLEKQFLEHIKRVNFGAKEVSATSVEYTFVFLPS